MRRVKTTASLILNARAPNFQHILLTNCASETGSVQVMVQAMSYHVFAAAILQLSHELNTTAGVASIC